MDQSLQSSSKQGFTTKISLMPSFKSVSLAKRKRPLFLRFGTWAVAYLEVLKIVSWYTWMMDDICESKSRTYGFLDRNVNYSSNWLESKIHDSLKQDGVWAHPSSRNILVVFLFDWLETLTWRGSLASLFEHIHFVLFKNACSFFGFKWLTHGIPLDCKKTNSHTSTWLCTWFPLLVEQPTHVCFSALRNNQIAQFPLLK